MTRMSCRSPLAWETLLAYRLGELEPGSEVRTEEHYLGCAQCSRRLEQLEALAQHVRALMLGSGVNLVVDHQFVSRLVGQGIGVREYRVPLNGSVNCTVTPEDDLVVARLEAPLHGVERVDLITVGSEGASDIRQEDIPIIAGSGEVIYSPSIEMLRALPATTVRIRLLAIDARGERKLGEYTFNHTPFSVA